MLRVCAGSRRVGSKGSSGGEGCRYMPHVGYGHGIDKTDKWLKVK